LTKYQNKQSILKSAMKQNCRPLSNTDDPQPTKNVPKKKGFSITEQRYVSRTAIKVNTTDTRLDMFIAS